jgi:hypothetical protein
MDLVVSSTLALDATHDVECYAPASGGAQILATFAFHAVVIQGSAGPCTSLL